MFKNKIYVYEVYREKSFSKAAEKLYISQPSLSAMVKKAETEIGTPIFDRSTTPIRLTECGEEYIRCIEQIFALENSFVSYLNDMKGLNRGHLSIGSSSFFVSYILPSLFLSYKALYPNVDIHLVEATTSALEKMLFKGELDFIIDNFDFGDDIYKREPFFEEMLLLAVPASCSVNERLRSQRLTTAQIKQDRHRQDPKLAVSLKEFADEPFLILRKGNDTRDRYEHICREAETEPRVLLKLDQQATAYHVACQGLGVSLVSEMLIKKVLPDDRLYFYRIDSGYAVRNNYIYYKQGKYITHAMKAFLKMTSLDNG